MGTELTSEVTGEVLRPGNADFDRARSMWNGRFDRSPDVVVACRHAGDVRAVVEHARREAVPLSVKCGGHSYAARTVADGGVLIDLSGMKDIRVDTDARTVDVGGGVTCGELDAATQAHGLATPLPTASSVGVAGATLGGGAGWLSRKHGLSLDNLLAAEVVTADGRILQVSEDEHPDLFWALRGAGANFGVATSLRFRLHEVGPQVLFGQVLYPVEDARSLLRFYRDFIRDAPEDVMVGPFFIRVPPADPFPPDAHGRVVLAFVFCNLDPDGEAAVQPLREQGEPLLDMVAPMPYVAVQQAFDASAPAGQRYYSKSHQLPELSDAVIDIVAEHAAQHRGELSNAYLFPNDGAIARVPATATAFPGRSGACDFHVLAGWIDPADDQEVMGWAQGFQDAVGEHATGGVYVNLVADDELDRVPAAYGANHARLCELKAEWDPGNLFRGNYNITPTTPKPPGPGATPGR